MRAVLQRALAGRVVLQQSEEVIGKIDRGLVVLLGISAEDTKEDVEWLAKKLTTIRLWEDENKKPWMHSINDLKYEVLVVSNFTLLGYLKGNRPDYHLAMPPAKAEETYNEFLTCLKKHIHDENAVACGQFGAMMSVETTNDGPVTLILDSKNKGGR
mmetsp:Transcript_38335/g.60727  ORF Transcript_38335/g.60727 Transcript_38335/m.60727 type:complete len:157 (-) Transcript_38335:193-663(-)|eukprot:CAMPEP_0201542790 /NCGR_PEP_ID=MMETSP0161_2-20130828/72224_1 /ASSEMBLY_ACC=CAM_ASM_000251 /TAXON_ID=180227 /ORGANISM="Neoparamoeba aestuarina, Strain SoJaBio B1-5/56/2" /LENGTH=156 /DNA_ID=CAMNT_0047950469 /DNA_START=58 /DNA_END=528 /DNA_ORIENTATION=-